MSPLTVGILGAGKLGTVTARLAIAAGHRVLIAGSGDPERIALIVDVLAPGAEAVRGAEVLEASDVVVMALPLGNLGSIPSDALAGKTVIDAMNYWWEIDGERSDLTDDAVSTSEIVQRHLAGARVVKALNHMGYHDLDDGPASPGTPGRKAIAVAADDHEARDVVERLIDSLGFDTVSAGSLHDSINLQPHSAAFGANATASELTEILREFPRTERGQWVARARAGILV